MTSIAGAPPSRSVLISVLHWNTLEATRRCLIALRSSSYANARIVLVDNASSDGSLEHIRREFPLLDVLCNTSNAGYAAGHELACQHAQATGADAIWLLNSDAEAGIDALAELVSAWHRHGDALFGAAPLHRNAHGELLLNFPAKYLDPDARPGAFHRDAALAWTPAWQSRPALRVGAVAGSCMLIPLAIVRAHGWLDAAWFMYCEEIDYCYRLRAEGVSAYLVPRAQVLHQGGGSQQGSAAVADCMAYYRTRNEIELTRRHGNRFSAGIVAAKKVLRALATAASAPHQGHLMLQGVRDALTGRMGKTLAP